MTKCADCHYLKNPQNIGRNSLSCSDLGEQPDSSSCSNFKPLETPENGNIPRLEFSYQDVMLETILDVFEIQKAADIVVNSVAIQLQQQGYSIDFDPKFFLTAVQKLSEIMTVHRLSQGLGLGSYQQDILLHMIADRFARRDIPSASLAKAASMQNRTSGSDIMENLHNDVKSILSEYKDAASTVSSK